MARNLAQLVFLVYCIWLLFRSGGVLRSLLLIRMKESTLEKNTRGLVNKFTFRRLKKALPPFLYRLNYTAVCAFAVDLVFQLLLGWFGFAALPAKILNSLAVILCGAEAWLTAMMDSLLRHEKLFVLYRWDPDGDNIFSSGILDLLLFCACPIAIVVSNFLAL